VLRQAAKASRSVSTVEGWYFGELWKSNVLELKIICRIIDSSGGWFGSLNELKLIEKSKDINKN